MAWVYCAVVAPAPALPGLPVPQAECGRPSALARHPHGGRAPVARHGGPAVLVRASSPMRCGFLPTSAGRCRHCGAASRAFLPHVQLCVQQRTLLCRAHLGLVMLQECRLELGCRWTLCCSAAVARWVACSARVCPLCDVCGHSGALFVERRQRLRGFCVARLPLLCVSLASVHLPSTAWRASWAGDRPDGVARIPVPAPPHAPLLTGGRSHPVPSAGLATWSAGAAPARRAGARWCFPACCGLSGCAVVAGCLACCRGLLQLRLRLCQRLHGARGAPATAGSRSARRAAAAVIPAACAGPGSAPAAPAPTPSGHRAQVL